MKSVCIQSFCGSYFPLLDWIRRDTKYFSIFSPNARKCGPGKLRIPTPFTKCQLNVPQVKNLKHGINSLTFWRMLRRNLLQSHLRSQTQYYIQVSNQKKNHVILYLHCLSQSTVLFVGGFVPIGRQSSDMSYTSFDLVLSRCNYRDIE